MKTYRAGKDGKVVLIAGGNKIYTDIAARFVRSERDLEEIVSSPYDKNIVKNILEGGHLAATEFDYFIFGVEGYARVTETQLVRKRMASYLIKSGRAELNGKRSFDVAYPESLKRHSTYVKIDDEEIKITTERLLYILQKFYEDGVKDGYPEEDLRYFKPQATAFKGIVGMNAHALLDFFSVRTCKLAQAEIRDMAWKMLRLCKKAAPDLFAEAGPHCVRLGYCPENKYQHPDCKGKIYTKDQVKQILHSKKIDELIYGEESND